MKQTADEKGYSKFEWIFYIIILPVLFISIITIVLLWFLDYDIKGKVLMTLNEIPFVEKLIDDKQFNNYDYLTITNSKEELEATIVELKSFLAEKEVTLTQAESQKATTDQQISDLKQEVEDLQTKLSAKNLSEISREQELANLAKIYVNMNPKNAAAIIAKLDFTEALLILSQMSIEAKSDILEKMDQKTAADISILLKDQKYSKDQDLQALQERINLLVAELDSFKGNQVNVVDYQQLATTYSAMEPKKAADALLSVYNTDQKKAKNILAAMTPTARSVILNQMDSLDAAKLTIGLIN